MRVQVSPFLPTILRIRLPSELLQEVLDDALPVVLWDMHGEQDMGYSDYGKKTSGTVVDGKLEIVVEQPAPAEIQGVQPFTSGVLGVDLSKTEQAVQNIHDKCHKISCCFCGKVTSSGDKDHHVDGSRVYSCSNCGSFQSMVDCPAGCVGWGPSGRAMVVTQPRRRRGPKAETLAETTSRIFTEKTLETALAPYVGKPNNDENRKAIAKVSSLQDKVYKNDFTGDIIKIGPEQTVDWFTPASAAALQGSIERYNQLVRDAYNIAAYPQKIMANILHEEKLAQELFMDAVWIDAHEKAETKPGDTCAPPPQKVMVVVRKMFERPEYAAVRKVAEEQAKRIVGRR